MHYIASTHRKIQLKKCIVGRPGCLLWPAISFKKNHESIIGKKTMQDILSGLLISFKKNAESINDM